MVYGGSASLFGPVSTCTNKRCCTDHSACYVRPGARRVSCSNRDGLGSSDHAVEGIHGDGDVARLCVARSCRQFRTDAVLVAANGGLQAAVAAITGGLLPSRAALIDNKLDMMIPSRRGAGVVRADYRRCARPDADVRQRIVMAQKSRPVDGRAIMGAGGDHAGNLSFHRLEQTRDCGDVAHLGVGQDVCHNLAAFRFDGQMTLAVLRGYAVVFLGIPLTLPKTCKAVLSRMT